MAQLPKFWNVLLDRIGHPELGEDPRFRTPVERLTHRDELTAIFDGIFGEKPVAHWIDLLAGHMPVSPVYALDQALDNPFLRETGMIDTAPHPDRADMRVLANPIRLDGERLPNRAAPLLGADTDAVLAEAGFGAAEIEGFREKGVV